MAAQSKLKRLMHAAKAEITSFSVSGVLAVVGVGLEQAAPLLKHSAPAHPALGALGDSAEAVGKMMQTVAVPAAGATFITLVTKFGKVWRDLTEIKGAKKSPARNTVHRTSPKLNLDNCFGGDMAGCEA